MSKKTFPHGIHPPEKKGATSALPIRRFPFASHFIVPLSQHAGRPARPVVRKGQEVRRGEPIAEPDGFVSVPIHSPVTGVVKNIGLSPNAFGQMAPAIFIEPYAASGQVVEFRRDHQDDLLALSPQEIVKAVQDTGMVGLGGAAFPTHVKLAVPPGKSVDTFLVNGIECEPYLTTDHRVMLENSMYIFKGIALFMKATGAKRAIIGIEANKPDAIALLRANNPDPARISVEELEVKYPQGAEKMLIKALLGREVPSGGLPVDIHVVVSNVATIAETAKLLERGEGLIERVVTVTGDGVARKGNYIVPLGTPLRFLLEQAGFQGDASQVILGGPMMGAAVSSLDIPVTKGVSGVLVLSGDNVAQRDVKEYSCIRCGSCVNACPMFLNPSRLGALAKKRRYEEMADEFNLFDCFECGSCSYVCPSGIPLVHYFRVSKGIIREKRMPL